MCRVVVWIIGRGKIYGAYFQIKGGLQADIDKAEVVIESIPHVAGIGAVVFVGFDVGEFGSDGVVEVSGLVVGEDVGDHESLEEELLGVGEGLDGGGHCWEVVV